MKSVLAALLLLIGNATASQPKRAAFAPPISTSLVAAKPGPATHMVYDTQRRQVVLLTGSKQSEREAVWGWDGKRWELVPGRGPEARELGGAAYDTRRKRIVLYGGMGLQTREDRKVCIPLMVNGNSG